LQDIWGEGAERLGKRHPPHPRVSYLKKKDRDPEKAEGLYEEGEKERVLVVQGTVGSHLVTEVTLDADWKQEGTVEKK